MHVLSVNNSDHCSGLSKAGSLSVEGCHRNICLLKSVYTVLDVERETSEERKARRDATLSKRGRENKVDHTQGDTNHQSQSLYCTQHLFINFILNQFMLFLQIN